MLIDWARARVGSYKNALYAIGGFGPSLAAVVLWLIAGATAIGILVSAATVVAQEKQEPVKPKKFISGGSLFLSSVTVTALAKTRTSDDPDIVRLRNLLEGDDGHPRGPTMNREELKALNFAVDRDGASVFRRGEGLVARKDGMEKLAP